MGIIRLGGWSLVEGVVVEKSIHLWRFTKCESGGVNSLRELYSDILGGVECYPQAISF